MFNIEKIKENIDKMIKDTREYHFNGTTLFIAVSPKTYGMLRDGIFEGRMEYEGMDIRLEDSLPDGEVIVTKGRSLWGGCPTCE